MEIDVKVTGLKELMDSMQGFVSPKLQQKLVQGSVKAAANVIKKEAEILLGKGKGYIGTGIPKRRRWSGITAAAISIGIRKKHWPEIFREYGSVERYTKKGARRGKIIMKAFLRPAVMRRKKNL